MENFYDIDRILLKYIREQALSVEEEAILQQWLNASQDREEMIKSFKYETNWMKEGLASMHQTSHTRIWDKLSSRLEDEGYWPIDTAPTLPAIPISRPARHRWRYLVAATVLFASAGATFWAFYQRPSSNLESPARSLVDKKFDAQPGTDRATLTLSDGRKLDLANTNNGVLANQGASKITKLANGLLAYAKVSSENSTIPLFNTLSTPRAGQFSLALPDGSRVWLNNASSLVYPVAFAGESREVELTGEAYFEIAKDSHHPFKVHIRKNNQSSIVEVLGTSFNIMAYDDEKTERTTLVEGGVRFIHGNANTLLKPEDQSVLDENEAIKTLHHVNVPEITAWKNGYFHFDHASLETTVRQLARWYDIDVEYVGNVPSQEFMGKIQRNLPLSSVLKGLENEHIHFDLQGRKLLVKP